MCVCKHKALLVHFKKMWHFQGGAAAARELHDNTAEIDSGQAGNWETYASKHHKAVKKK